MGRDEHASARERVREGWAIAAARVVLVVALVAFAATVAAGCGGSAQGANGVVVLGMTVNRDPTGWTAQVIKECNASSGGKWRIEQIVLPQTVDDQRTQIIRRLAGRDSTMSIIGTDVVWTAELSSAGWLLDLTKRVQPIEKEFVPTAIDTVKYDGRYWALPYGIQTALLYYRKDLVKTPPKTWEQLSTDAQRVRKAHPDMAGLVWQANQYEGLTVDALEFIFGAGGSALSADGKHATFTDGPGTVKAFTFMRKLFTSGVTPKSVTTYQEEESRQAFQSGHAVFLRNWPYVFPLLSSPGSKVKGKFGVAPLPGFAGHAPASVVGGGNYAISRFTPNGEYAWQAVSCLSSQQHETSRLLMKGDTPAREAVYHDKAVLAKLPFLAALRTSLDVGHNRPVSPYYNSVSTPINRIAHEVVSGKVSPKAAAKQLDHSTQLAIEGNGEI